MGGSGARSDADIQSDVLTELKRDPRVKSQEINVLVENGVVALTGWVDSYSKRWAAAAAAHRIEGVKAVANDIEVQMSSPDEDAGADVAATALATEVLAELSWDPRLQPNQITVIVKDGVVTLTGWVDSYSKRWAAAEAAHRIRGVKAVANDIEVRLSGSDQHTDADMAETIVSALEWDGLTPTDMLDVTVSEGWVTLKGEVEWEYQKHEAERVVCRLKGVTGVTNMITVKPRVLASALKEKIEAALVRNADTSMNRIVVAVEDSAVILTGTVSSWAEREEVERAVWSAPGITSVDNRISVSS
jgi:osmotically-inducible protein OsmY